MPAPNAPPGDDSHQRLLDTLDLALKAKPFRNPNWKPSQRRNKNVKQILGEASRREASVLATQNNSGTATPANGASSNTNGTATPPLPVNGSSNLVTTQANISQAAQNLSTMVLERNLQASMLSAPGAHTSATIQQASIGGPIATYTNIESAPSLHPGDKKRYCDITGLPATYTDPKSRLRYVNTEVFDVVRTLPQGVAEKYLETRGAHVILK